MGHRRSTAFPLLWRRLQSSSTRAPQLPEQRHRAALQVVDQTENLSAAVASSYVDCEAMLAKGYGAAPFLLFGVAGHQMINAARHTFPSSQDFSRLVARHCSALGGGRGGGLW